MLVLSRRQGEEIWIGDEIRLIITEIGRDKVRIGIAAPAEIEIDRHEVRMAKLRERDKGGPQ